MRLVMTLSVICLSVGVLGCSPASQKDKKAAGAGKTGGDRDLAMSKRGVALGDEKAMAAQAEAPAGKEGKQQDGVQRKIIYTGTLTVMVENLGKAEEELKQQLKAHKGIVAHSNLTSSPGAPRRGEWRVRVPVAQFDAFREAVAGLGEVEVNTTDSEDVTDRYYDLDARIKNKEVHEAVLRKLLDRIKTDKATDLLPVSDAIDRVREQIEVMQGQKNRLEKLSALTTLTITLYERTRYIPEDAASFGTRIGRTFVGSVDVLVDVGKGVLLVLTAVAPWLPLLVLLVVPIWVLSRRQRPLAVTLVAEERGTASSAPREEDNPERRPS